MRLFKRERPDARLPITIMAYRQTYSHNDYSKKVLVWHLERCGFLKRIDTEEQRVLHNWGIELLENMGVTQGLNYDRIVDAILRFPIPEEAVDTAQEEMNG